MRRSTTRICQGSRSSAATIAEQRDRIEALMEENPSLRHGLEDVARSVYPLAVRLAAIETGLSLPYDERTTLGDEGEADAS